MSNVLHALEMDMPPPSPLAPTPSDRELLDLVRTRVDEEIQRLEGEATGWTLKRGAPAAATRERMERAARKLRILRQLARELATAYPRDVSLDGAGLGSMLTLEDCVTGDCLEYMLMSGEDIDFAGGQVSLASPVGRAVHGATPGATVDVALPRGIRSFRILSVTTLPAALGVVPAPEVDGATGRHPRRRANRRAIRAAARDPHYGSAAR